MKKRKKHVSIPLPRWKQVPSGKVPRKDGSIPRSGFNAKGAFGGSARRQARQEFISDSQRQATKLASDRALKKAYHKFFSTAAGRAFVAKFGRSTSSDSSPRRSKTSTNDIDFHDPAEIPHSVGCGKHNGKKLVTPGAHPVDELEPQITRVAIEGLSEEQIVETSETFGLALRWALDNQDIVARGRRSIVMVACMRPDLGAGFKVDVDLARQFVTLFNDKLAVLESCGLVFARYLEWVRRGGDLASIGERLDLTAYTLRPDLLPAATLAKLGAIVGKTRQAKDKLAGCLRDSFSGIQGGAMRPEITRDRCRASQLSA